MPTPVGCKQWIGRYRYPLGVLEPVATRQRQTNPHVQFLLPFCAGCFNLQQQTVIDYMQAENQSLW